MSTLIDSRAGVRRALRFGSAIAIAFAVLAGAGACQIALRAGSEGAQCDVLEKSPCDDTGLTCQNNVCVPCIPAKETCNLADDDCDGVIDNGFDHDGDGFFECGTKAQLDCDDENPAIFPGAPEICNGIDDNCNGAVDELPNGCPPGQECWSAQQKCVTQGSCLVHACPEGSGCDTATGTCTAVDCVAAGNKCSNPAQVCDPTTRTCLSVSQMGEPCDDTLRCAAGQGSCVKIPDITVNLRGTAVCAASCCASEDCPSGFFCKTASTGASVCVNASALTMTLGNAPAAATCTSGADCRSGTCKSGTCFDGCCASETCGSGNTGTCSVRDDGNGFVCRGPAGSKSFVNDCSASSQCKSGFCQSGGAVYNDFCSKHCCTSSDCVDPLLKCTAVDVGSGFIANVCALADFLETTGSRLGGDTCSTGSDCRSGKCSGGRCEDICCHDSDCADGSVCAPRHESIGGATAAPMRCVPK